MLGNFFSQDYRRTVWNTLPISLINYETIATLKKKHLDCLLKNRGYLYKLFSFFLLVKPLFLFWGG